MTAARNGFQAFLLRELKELPFTCGAGAVRGQQREVQFGFRGGRHQPTPCWVYERSDVTLDLLFGFYENFTDADLITKVVQRGEKPAPGTGASVQFNGDRCVEKTASGGWTLSHHGRVTVGSSIRRDDLVSRIESHAPKAAYLLGPIGGAAWPIAIGDTDNTSGLLDQLFVYVYAIEQAKRSFREEKPIPTLL